MTLLEKIKAIGAANRLADYLSTAQALRLYATDAVQHAGADSALNEARKELAQLNELLASVAPFADAPNPQATTAAVDAYAFADRDCLAAAVDLGQRTSGHTRDGG